MDETALFGGLGNDVIKKKIENHLQSYCNPLTLGQKYADWFLIKCLISNRIAGKIVAKLDKIPIDHNFMDDDEMMRSILRRCMES